MKPALASLVRCLPSAALCLLLGGCNASFVAEVGDNFTIGGTITGLPANQSLVLVDNGNDVLTITANGSFVFANTVPFNGGYAVGIRTQPARRPAP
jgi:hypothetical protein